MTGGGAAMSRRTLGRGLEEAPSVYCESDGVAVRAGVGRRSLEKRSSAPSAISSIMRDSKGSRLSDIIESRKKFSLQHSSRNRKRCWIRYPRAVKWLPRLAAPSRALRQHRCYPARRELVRSRNLPRYRSTVRPLPTLRPSVPTSVRCLALLRLALHWLVANTRSPPANIRSLTPFHNTNRLHLIQGAKNKNIPPHTHTHTYVRYTRHSDK